MHWLFNVTDPDTQGHSDLFLTFNWSLFLLWHFASYLFSRRYLFVKIRFNWPNYRVILSGIEFQFIWKGHVDSRQNFCRSRTQIGTTQKCLNALQSYQSVEFMHSHHDFSELNLATSTFHLNWRLPKITDNKIQLMSHKLWRQLIFIRKNSKLILTKVFRRTQATDTMSIGIL